MKAETNALVQAECARLLSGEAVAPPSQALKEVVALLESSDVEQRRSGLRLVLNTSLLSAADTRLESALLHHLDDRDTRVRVLATAVFLHRSLAADPLAAEEAAP